MAVLILFLSITLGMTTPHADEHPVRSQTRHIDKASIFYLEGGPPDGLPVLFLHGAAFHSGTWRELGSLDTLSARGYRIIAIDLPGFGLSQPSSLTPLAFMEALLDTLDLDRPVVISPSMSGRFSLPLAIERTDLIRGYIPVAPVGVGRYGKRLKQITVPTLIFWGTQDAVIPFAQAGVMERGIPNSAIFMMKGARHPCYLDDPELFHKGLIDFLDEMFIQKD